MKRLTKELAKTIETDFEHGVVLEDGKRKYYDIKELATYYKVSYDSLRQKSSKEKWTEKKEAYLTKVSQKITEKKSEYDAECIVQSDEKFEGSGEKLRQLIEISMDKDLERLKEPEGYVKPYSLKMYGDALTSAQSVVKTSQGEITERIKIDSDSNVNLSILDDDFNQKELEFMQSLIKKD